MNFIDEELKRRHKAGMTLAERFPELVQCEDYVAFLFALDKLGLDLDFVTGCEMWDALQAQKKDT